MTSDLSQMEELQLLLLIRFSAASLTGALHDGRTDGLNKDALIRLAKRSLVGRTKGKRDGVMRDLWWLTDTGLSVAARLRDRQLGLAKPQNPVRA